MQPHEIIEYKGYKIEIYHHEDAESPLTHFGNLGTMYTRHHRYNIGENFDEHLYEEEVFDGEFGVFKKSFLRQYIALPLYLYDHSGQTINTTGFSCPWDTSRIGIIAVSLDDVRKEYGWKNITKKRREQIETYLRAQVKLYDDYVRGSVYGFRLIDPDGEEHDSCWGYYGDESIKDIEAECKATVNGILITKNH